MSENVSRIAAQHLYDHFNPFMMSNDQFIFGKLIARAKLYEQVRHIPGDIVECGVFKGTGMYTFLKLKRIYNPTSIKKVIGFDYFNTNSLLSSIADEQSKKTMQTLFEDRNFSHPLNYKTYLHDKLIQDGFLENEFMLVEGDISITSRTFANQHPGFKISLLYMDLDLEIPTYNTLINFWNNITTGGIVIFDEYANLEWSESKGVDKFLQEKNLKIYSIDCTAPTAYIVKD